MINILIIILLSVCVCVYLYCNKMNISFKSKEKFTFEKIPLWTYNNVSNNKNNMELFSDLCIETFKKHNSDDFEIIVIDELSLNRYIDDLDNNFKKFNDELKMTYIKFNLLYRYGGIWIDMNTIILSNLKFFTDRLIQYDYIGFGSTEEHFENNNYYSKPLMNVCGSRKSSILCKTFIEKMNKLISSNKTVELNNNYLQNVFWECIENLIKDKNYEYYHFSPLYTGEYDNEDEIINDNRLFSSENINIDLTNIKLIKINFNKFKNINELDKDTIYYIKNNVVTLFRKSLYPEHPYPELNLVINKNVDVYVLYISKREEYIKNAIDRIFLNPIYFKGFNKNELNEEELVNNEFISKEWTESPKFNFGRVACHMGHMAIMKQFLTTTTKYALIFEDDIYIDLPNIDYYKEKIKKILENIPEEAQAVYLSFCWEKCKLTKKYNEIFSESHRPLCRHMYLVSREGARIILKETKKLVKPGDNTISDLIQKKVLKSYNVNPEFFIVNQNRQSLGSNLDNNKIYSICKA